MPEQPVSEEEYFITVGKLVHHATVAETLLALTFRLLSGCNEAIANAIFYTVDALPTRKNLVNRVLNVVNHDDEDRRLVNELFDAATLTQTQRNELAHAMLMQVGPDGRLSRMRLKDPQQPFRPISAAYLDSLINLTADALTTAIPAYGRLCEKRGVPPVTQLA